MEENKIKLLYIDSKVHALVNINQAPAGETGVSAITQPIAGSATFFITMLPLENEANFSYLPYTRRVSLASGGAIFSNDGLVELCIWPDNIVELTLFPQTVFKSEAVEIFPSVLCPFDFFISGERHTAFIYNEAYSIFAVEHSASNRLVFLSPLPFFAASAEIAFTKLNDFPVLYAWGKTQDSKPFIYAVSILPGFNTAICTLCEEHYVEGSRISVVTNGEFHQLKTIYERQDSRLVPAAQELGWFTCEKKEPSTPSEVCMSLLQAVKAGLSETAMGCLTPSLADGLSFSDLKEFFGDFTQITHTVSPACGPNSFALKYASGRNIYTAREFCVETKQSDGALLIDNIREP